MEHLAFLLCMQTRGYEAPVQDVLHSTRPHIFELHTFISPILSNRWWTTLTSNMYVPICVGLMAVFRTGTVYSTIAVTLERYFAIAKPLHDFTKIQKILHCFTVTFAVVFNIPKVTSRSDTESFFHDVDTLGICNMGNDMR